MSEGCASGERQGVRAGAEGGDRAAAPAARTIASLSLWRDWATIWESRADLFTPEVVQGFAQLDTLAGQFFGGREFGADVLGAFDPHWRLVVAQQDYAAMKPAPDHKLPAFAIVAELNGSQDDFAERLKIAFQAIIGISNVEAAQKKAAALELGSEEVDGVTHRDHEVSWSRARRRPANEPAPSGTTTPRRPRRSASTSSSAPARAWHARWSRS